MTKPGALYTLSRVSVSVAVTMLLMHGNVFAAGESTQKNAPVPEAIVGVWESTATVIDCNTGAVRGGFKGLSMFNIGGTASYGGNTPPASSSASMGTWQRESGQTYTITLVFYRFNPDGTTTMQKSKGTRILSADENSFTGTVNGQIIDTAGNVLAHTCVTDTGSRVSW